MNPLLALADDELVEVLTGRIDEDDLWILDELVRRYVVTLFRLHLAERNIEENSWLSRLGMAA